MSVSPEQFIQIAARPQPTGPQFQHLQALEDAIRYRRARADQPCENCAATNQDRCDDHGRDLDLAGEYERTLHELSGRVTD
jgi:hypothetical protein